MTPELREQPLKKIKITLYSFLLKFNQTNKIGSMIGDGLGE